MPAPVPAPFPSDAGAGSFSFLDVRRKPVFAPRRWQVFYWEGERWHRFPAAMPEAVCASYAETQRRYAGAICMEAVPNDWIQRGESWGA